MSDVVDQISPAFVRFVTRNLAYWQEQAPAFDDAQIRRLATEHDNIARAITLALTLPATRPAATQLLLDYVPFVEQQGQWETWQPLVERALASVAEEDGPLPGRLLNCLGRLHRFQHRLAAAIDAHEQAEALGSRLADPRLLAVSKQNLCIAYRRRRQYATARAYGREALALFQEMEDVARETADVLNALGLVALREKDLDAAEVYLRRAAATWRALEMPANLGRTLNNLALVLQEQEKYEAALRLYQDAQEQLASTVSFLDQIRVQNSLGTLYFRLDQFEQAEIVFRQLYRRALRRAGDLRLQGAVALNLGNSLLKQGEFDEAERYLARAVAVWQQLGDELHLANTLGAVAEVQAGRQQIEKAVATYRRSLDLLARYPDEPWAKRLRETFTAERDALVADRAHPRR